MWFVCLFRWESPWGVVANGSGMMKWWCAVCEGGCEGGVGGSGFDGEAGVDVVVVSLIIVWR